MCKENVRLDKYQRLNLINQFKILEKLYPDEASYYAVNRTALAEGYELHYDWIFESVYDGLNHEQCNEVLNILDMHRAFLFSFNNLPETEQANIDFEKIKFKGFDGNNEGQLMGYVRYFIIELGRFDELKYDSKFPSFNSHSPMIESYQKMLQKWESIEVENKFNLTASQILDIIEH